MVLLLCTVGSSVTYAREIEQVETTKLITEVVSVENYDGWELEWKYEEEFFDLLVGIMKDEESVRYRYNDNFQRIEKMGNDGSKITFSYDAKQNLISEKRENVKIDYVYLYDEASRTTFIDSFIYNGVTYKYIYSNDIIVGLSKDGEEIARYSYNAKEFAETLELVNGEWRSNDDANFIGNINKIRYKGFYYDDETGWYYKDRYFDPKCNCYIDGLNMNQARQMISEYGIDYEAEILLASNFFGVDMLEGDDCYSGLARSDSYGEIETIARVLYAESNVNTYDQAGVAWVIYNRAQTGRWKDAYAVVTASGQFSGYQSNLYYNPNQSSSTWTTAVNEAVRLSVGNIPYRKPAGFSSQKNFVSVSTFQKNLTSSSGKLYYRGTEIYDVYIVGYGVVTSATTLKSSEITALSGKYNIFFKYYDE